MWDFYQQDVVKVEKEWNILCFGWKWKGEKATHVIGLPDFPRYYEKDAEASTDDKPLCEFLWKLLNEADIVVAHNGKDFDQRKINARFLKHGMTPPKPAKWVDTLITARKHFKLNQNTLKYLCEYLGVVQKIDTGGFKLWFQCINRDLTAWKKMYRYNKRDVVALEQVYERLLPWMDTHPNVSLPSGQGHRCPRCGSANVRRMPGWRYLKSWRAARYRCFDCGRESQGEREKLPFGVLQ